MKRRMIDQYVVRATNLVRGQDRKGSVWRRRKGGTRYRQPCLAAL